MMKKVILILVSFSLTLMNSFGIILAVSNDEFKENEEYYRNYCTAAELDNTAKAICKEFAYYLSSKSEDLNNKINEINKKIDQIQKDIKTAGANLQTLKVELETLTNEIRILNGEITELTVRIEEKAAEIETKEKEVEELRTKVKNRMVAAQGTMRLNQYIDFLMGATSFEDMLRRISMTNDLMAYDEKVRVSLKNLIEELNIAKAQLEEDKIAVEEKKAELEAKQNSVILQRELVEEALNKLFAMEADLEAEGNKYIAEIDSLKKIWKDLEQKIDDIPSSSSWTKPVSGGTVTANTWYYPKSFGGGVHLGLDISKSMGTEIKAVANGFILKVVDGCKNEGYIGNACGSVQGGTSGGGNQVLQLAYVDGNLYAIKYLHLSPGLDKNLESSSVMAGDKIGSMGASGNVTGTHLHIEIYRLGKMSINSYLSSWDGNLSFGCGWGSAALNRTCANSGTPCRERPEDKLGY